MVKLYKSSIAIVVLLSCVVVSRVAAFAPAKPVAFCARTTTTSSSLSQLFAEPETEAVFVPPEEEEEGADAEVDVVASLERGSAKAKRGKKKGGAKEKKSKNKASVSLAPEEVYYEGPPAISETFFPTLSVVFVVGIVPALAAWSRQVWVRYKITTRRIRVTSGIGGNDMAEIVYPDVVELRTAKRLFGDGDMVLFLRDGAKFEMRNVPEFEDALEFILKQLDPEVVAQYRETGDVTNP